MTGVDPGIFKAYDIRGIHGEQIDRRHRRADRSGVRAGDRRARGQARPPSCGSAWGATCGSPRRRWPPPTAAGMCAEGATVLDAGQVGTEMLYFLVGSRDLDGGIMCTASHNPKQYTGAKLVKRGAIALSGRRRHRRHPPTGSQAGLGERAGRRERGGGRRPRRVPATRPCASSTPAQVRPLKVVVDGGNGMAGPMVGPLLERLGLELETAYWQPGRQLPRSRAQSAAAREPRVHHARGHRPRRRPRDRLGRRRRPLLLHRRHRCVRRRRLPHRAARRVDARQAPRRHDPLRRAREPGGAGHRRARRRHAAAQPRRPRVLQDPDARGGRRVRRRGVRPLLLPRLLLRRLGHDSRRC